MTVTAGPAAQPPLTIGTLTRKVEALERAVQRLQINRTPAGRTLGSLNNVSPKMDGAGLSGGETPVYSKASGTYQPGHATGATYRSLSYVNYNGVVYLWEGAEPVGGAGTPVLGGFLVHGGSAAWQFIATSTNYGYLFGVSSTGGLSTNQSGYPSIALVAFSSMPHGSATPNDFLIITVPFWGVIPQGQACSAFTSVGAGSSIVTLPRLTTPTWFSPGPIQAAVHLNIINGAGTRYCNTGGTVNLSSNSTYQVQTSDITTFVNHGLAGPHLGLDGSQPSVLTSVADVYCVKINIELLLNPGSAAFYA
jgi:hypothetical protein